MKNVDIAMVDNNC